MLMFQREVAERIVAAPGRKSLRPARRCSPAGAREARILFDVRAARLHAAAEGHLVGRATWCRGRRRCPAIRDALRARDRGRLRPAPQDAAPEPEVARRRCRRRCSPRPASSRRARAEEIAGRGLRARWRARLRARSAERLIDAQFFRSASSRSTKSVEARLALALQPLGGEDRAHAREALVEVALTMT